MKGQTEPPAGNIWVKMKVFFGECWSGEVSRNWWRGTVLGKRGTEGRMEMAIGLGRGRTNSLAGRREQDGVGMRTYLGGPVQDERG